MRVRLILPAVTLALLPHQQAPAAGAAVITQVVEYECTAKATGERQNVDVTIQLTMPTGATAGEQLSIGWRGTYVRGSELLAPAGGLTAGTKLYAYASISDFPGLTSATGVGELGTPEAGEIIPLPSGVVPLRTTPNSAGTGTVRPAAINFGPRPTEPEIECEVLNEEALTTYPLTVTAGTGGPDDDPGGAPDDDSDPAPVNPQPTRTVTATATATAVETVEAEEDTPRDGVVRTPKGGAATGGGGEAGPDGRTFVATGLLLVLAAGAGLLLRRRRGVRSRPGSASAR
ncbi:hypothetical protein ACFFMN_42920 [Planobispora siamensis]|uniref:LPXTG cell wall anchor domain-containing protein n=1 Tax=Planobispora siamensis TaxID=936338 RepID=A0A8J3SPA1_9ACTN|nr:hypothetical protein [Planobispora siamensis]GIH96205.1 hypothetical protein Psi01_68350 [Planobispora siamensis]